MLNNDKEFIYFLYGLDYSCRQTILEIFSKGLYSEYGHSLDLMCEMVNKKDELYSAINEYYCENVLIIKIPKVCCDGLNYALPLPMWRVEGNHRTCNNEYYLTSNLIYGVYNKNKNKTILNHNYSTTYNPNGLQYDYSLQTLPLFTQGNLKMYRFMNERSLYYYNELLERDKNNHTFDVSINYYNNYFKNQQNNVKPKVLRKDLKKVA